EHYARFNELLVVPPHLLEQGLGRHDARLGFLVRLYQDPDLHLPFLLYGLSFLPIRRMEVGRIDNYPPAMAPMTRNGSAPDATASGSGASGGSFERSCSLAWKRMNARRIWGSCS